ncbi:Crp/Fnr family transcriptional regulator [Campylobacter novaezeelandiae]|uniref:Crp/Fnr family transcriptional regulator n=1 Tax=Campylobacter novaezeelandiae TaxID=2267891 RepID=UPI001036F8B8|nr:Crp/Fnr family transcriptional regulator [Campylobacter novaezeelandiae]TBR80856.1 Crp/Fnr family transcriptional regulator [Campylobacter novaezeelandiae]
MEDYLNFLHKIGNIKRYKKNNILFYEDEQAKNFFILLKGKVRVYKSINDKEMTLHHFLPTSFIAEMPAFKRLKYPANAEFEEESEILEINFEKFYNLCLENTKFNFLLIASLFEKIKILEKKLLQNSLGLKERVISYILENEQKLDIMTQKQISLDLNVRVESLSRILKEFKNKNLLTTNKGKITILDKEKLIKNFSELS